MSDNYNGKTTPCNGCVSCCKSDAVGLYPHENMAYQSEPHAFFPGQRMIAHKENGDCVYLAASGCSIHGHAPIKCQTMDCRNIFTKLTPREAMENGLAVIWSKGKILQEKERGE